MLIRGWAELETVLSDIAVERKRQLALKAQGRFRYTPSDNEISDYERLAMLLEEVGETARAVLAQSMLVQENSADHDVRHELTQVAAIATAWLERYV